MLGAGAQAAGTTPLNAPPPPAPPPDAADTIGLAARFPGGSNLPDQPGANFSVHLVRDSLASSERLALRQPAGTLVQQGNDFFVMGGVGNPPLQTTAGGRERCTSPSR